VSELRASAWLHTSPLDEYGHLCAARLRHLVAVREPYVLVSQVQRSGGTLLSQLFDGHPECHAHPQEVKIGHPKKWYWPSIDLERPDTWFGLLYEPVARKHLLRGYEKGPQTDDVFPFLFSPRLQAEIFDAVVAAGRIESQRDVLDAYFTSYFNAWLDNHNLYTGPKKAVTGFTPRLAAIPESVDSFFAAYPDGTLLSIVRDPRSWFASARKHWEKYADVDRASELWRRSTEAILATAQANPDRVLLLTYDQLVLDTEGSMRRIAARIGIAFDPVLLTPTFNGRPIRANSHHQIGGFGVLSDRTSIYRSQLDRGTIAAIERATGDLYERARAAAGDDLSR
jgi:hypothetical protein